MENIKLYFCIINELCKEKKKEKFKYGVSYAKRYIIRLTVYA